jgi:hypothetical protein
MSASPSSAVQAVLAFVVAQVSKLVSATPIERAVKTFVVSYGAQWAILQNSTTSQAKVAGLAALALALYTSHVEPVITKVQTNRALLKAAKAPKLDATAPYAGVSSSPQAQNPSAGAAFAAARSEVGSNLTPGNAV